MKSSEANLEPMPGTTDLIRMFVGGTGFGMVLLGLCMLTVLLPDGVRPYARFGPLVAYVLSAFIVRRRRRHKAPNAPAIVARTETVVVLFAGMLAGVLVATHPWYHAGWAPPHTREAARAAAQMIRHRVLWDAVLFGAIGTGLMVFARAMPLHARGKSRAEGAQ